MSDLQDFIKNISNGVGVVDCSKPTLHRWKKSGIVPFVRLGSNIRYKQTDLEKLIKTKGE